MQLIKSLSFLSPTLKKTINNVEITNLVFKLHYRVTFMIFMVCTALVCLQEYIGEHIRCVRGGKYLPEKAIDRFCFFTATFTVVKNYNTTETVAHPGVGPYDKDDEIIVHAYYQWVPFVLFLQGLCFYAPYAWWKHEERGRMKAYTAGFTILDELDETKKRETMDKVNKVLVKNLKSKQEVKKHLTVNKSWALYMILAEILNFINVTCQIFLTNWFLGGKFLTLGPEYLRTKDDEFTVLERVFPKVTKCNFYKYGASGTAQTHDILCVMALNVINEKIYLCLWWWFLFLSIFTCLSLMWRLVSFLFHRKVTSFNKYLFSLTSHGNMDKQDVKTVFPHLAYSDWIFLYYLARNLQGQIFRYVFEDLAEEMRKGTPKEKESLSSRASTSSDDSNNSKKPLYDK